MNKKDIALLVAGGYLLDDEGAGYWIAISALREILFELELGVHDSRLGPLH